MREICFEKIKAAVAEGVIRANTELPQAVCERLQMAKMIEGSAASHEVYDIIEQNIGIAGETKLPLCQDTGSLVCLVELGQEVHIVGGLLTDAINEGIREGYDKGSLRKSILSHPLLRINTGDNTPGIVHIKLVEGDKLRLTLMPKGGGAENMSAVAMLPPSAGREGVCEFVVNTVKKAGANPCPPIFVGVGIGGNFESCAIAAKYALAREAGKPAIHPYNAGLEQELLLRINELGIGAQGFGGDITALAVAVETLPCHIASLPVAVNINCHVARHIEIEL